MWRTAPPGNCCSTIAWTRSTFVLVFLHYGPPSYDAASSITHHATDIMVRSSDIILILVAIIFPVRDEEEKSKASHHVAD